MALENQVKQYLACWFQLGKRIVNQSGRIEPTPGAIILGAGYAPEFNDYWQKVVANDKEKYYLEGTEVSIQTLLSTAWEIVTCARCDMPIPAKISGIQCQSCPCDDIYLWPNKELPQPRSPVDSRTHLEQIRQRLEKIGKISPNLVIPLPASFPRCPCAQEEVIIGL